MALELCTYGVMCGLMYQRFSVYPSLIAALIGGRIVNGIANWIFYGMAGSDYGWSAFLSGSLLVAWPGIVIQLILVPVLVYALARAGLIKNRA